MIFISLMKNLSHELLANIMQIPDSRVWAVAVGIKKCLNGGNV
jgi:hypothetical protein